MVISKQTRLNRAAPQQRIPYRSTEKDKTEAYFIPTENLALSHRKRQDVSVSHPNRDLCTQRKINWFMSTQQLELNYCEKISTQCGLPQFEASHQRSRQFHIHIHIRPTFSILSTINQYIYIYIYIYIELGIGKTLS